MLMNRNIIIICFALFVGVLGVNNANAQCDIIVDTANITQVTCPGGADGFASLDQNPYINYSWDNITNGQNYGSGPLLTTVSTLAAGLYVVTGTNPFSGSCPNTMTSDTFEIIEPIVVNNFSTTICDTTNCNGTSTIDVNQQFPGYTYQVGVNGGASQALPATANNLCAGNQTYTVSYNDGVSTTNCPASTFNIAGGSLGVTTYLFDTIMCFGDLASFYAVTTGGGGWYTYDLHWEFFGTWNFFGTQTTFDTATFINIPANNYRVTVTDSVGGCTAQAFINISQPPNLMPTFSIANPSLCFGDSTADLNLNILGGTMPYSVTLNNGASIPVAANNIDFLNVPAGSYQVIITDANGCQKTRNLTVTSPPLLVPNSIISSNYNGQDISCFGESDGAILAQVMSGGTPGFQYAINGGAYVGNPFFPNLSSGTYAVNYMDTNGCTVSDTLTLQDPLDLSGTISVSSAISCNSVCDGQITFTVDGVLTGTPTYQYSLDGGAFQASNVFGGLCGDVNYSITVRDINNCTYIDSLFLTQPDSLDIYVSVISNYNGWGVSCNGTTDGTISVDSVNGGTPLYTYSIDNGPFGSSTFFTGLAGGMHTIVVQDASGCSQTMSINITEPNPYTIALTTNVNYNGFDVACNGDCNGSIHVTSTGGVPSYLYSLDGGASQASANFNNQCANNLLTVDATDANGCTAEDSIVLIEPPVLTLQMDSIMENCGAGDGQAIAIVGGGVSPYFYLWTDGQTTSTAINLSTGTYTVIVTDTNGCSVTDNVFVPGTNMILSTTSTDVGCNNGSDGTATVVVNGAFAPVLTYQWDDSNFQSTATATGLAAGTYIVQVTDGNGCTTSDTVDVLQPNVVSLELDSANSLFMVPCFGDSLGVASVSATGGTGQGTYWFYIDAANPQNDSTFYGLPAGSYLIFVIDANNCTDSVAVQITQPAEITFSLTSTDVLCNGGATGTAEVATISGGTPPYIYNWNNGATTDSIGGLLIGNYWLVVSDTSGCNTIADTITINEPTILQTIVSSTSSMCGGTVANGTAGVVASGGTPNYSYLWNTGATTSNINLLVAGTYTVIITDANGCNAYDTVVVQQGPQPILSVAVQDVSCFGANDGIITPTATAGTSPYQFSINGGSTWQNSGVQYGPSGQASYFVTVRDDNGCVTSDSVFVLEPLLLVVDSFTINQVSCYGGSDGSLIVNHSGGTSAFTYSWSDGQTTNPATNLSIGTYTVIITDANGCDTTASVTMTEPDSLYITSITSTDVLCNGGNDGTATVTATGGVIPYSYQWSNGAITQTAMASAGNLTVDVTDSNGCIVSGNITVNEPAALVVSFTMDSVFCFGFSDGSATAFVSGGIPSYNYLWDNGDNTNFADSLDAGHHLVTITDFNNCVLIDSVEVLQPASSVTIDSLIVAQISCKDASNGSIVVLATGGIPPYTYSKDGGNTYQTAIGFIGLSPATYNIMVKDNKGCTASVLQTITEPDSLLIDSIDFQHVSCFGYNNGYISDIHVSGGTQPWMYSVNGSTPQQYPVFNSSINPGVMGGPGTYTVEVFDDHNCVVADIIIIEEPQPLNTNITTSDYNGYEIKCNSDSTGWISVNVNGGVAPFLKTWINAQGDTIQSSFSSTVNNLNAGLYSLIVLDVNGCARQQYITMAQPTPIQHTMVTTHVTCDGWSNGSITDSVFGGVPGYTYLWNTGDTTYSLNNLPIGTYNITATDENNCTTPAIAVVNDDDKLVANVANVQNVSCWGYCDGYIEVTTSGGIPFYDSFGNEIYTNLWDDPLSQIDSTAIGLCADSNTLSTMYTITITDAIGCVVTDSAAITQPAEVEVDANITNEVSCYAGNDGSIQASTTGGIPSYTYLWNNQQTGNTINNLVTGSYVVVATDANGCMDTTEIFLAEPDILSVDIDPILDVTHVSCFGFNDGTITANPIGGTPITPSLTYNYLWSDGQNTKTATGLSPGLYYVDVTDANGCTVTSSSVLITQPSSELIVTADSTDETCVMNDGTAIANVFGGTPTYSYSWSNGQTTPTIANLLPGTYTVDVTDANGCTLSASTYVNAFDAIFLPNFTSQFSYTICLGDNITISVVDNPDFTYSWSSGQITPTITVKPDAPRTDYILTVVDVNCPTSSFDVTATIWTTQLPIVPYGIANGETYSYPLDVPIKVDDDVEIGSSYSYPIYEWTDKENVSIANSKSTYVSPEVTSTYYIMVEDANGCQGFDSIRVVVGVYVFDGISPNGDGYNDFWEIEDIDRYPDAVIEVYNRWGSLLFSAKGDTYNSNKWDGTHNGEMLPIGTYYYIINLNNDSEPQSGPITIVR